MTLAASAPRGGLIETFGGAARVVLLDNAAIERIEDAHGSIFELQDGFFGRGSRPTSRQVRDVVAMGLVGGGLTLADADEVMTSLTPADLAQLYAVAQAAIGVAFFPDWGESEEAAGEDDDGKKASPLAAGT